MIRLDANEFTFIYPALSRLVNFYAVKYCYKKEDLKDFKQELWLKLWDSYLNVYEKDHPSGASPVTWASHTLKLAAKQVAFDKSRQDEFEEQSIVHTDIPLENLEIVNSELEDNVLYGLNLDSIRTQCIGI